MSELLGLFLNSLLPVFLVAGAGFLLGRWLHVNPRPLSQVTFYIFTPCLVFTLLAGSQLNGWDVLRMVAFAGLIMAIVGLAAWGAGRVLKLERRVLMAVLLTSMFMNAGNFGLPLNSFAFGPVALAYASLYFVTSSILTNTVGVVIASMGSTGFRQSLLGLIRIPTIYALVLGLLFNRMGWKLPLPLDRSFSLLADAAVPAMLLLLGLQFQHARWQVHTRAVALSSAMRLLVAPALAFGMSLLFGLHGPARQAGILESAMPSAVLSTVLATEYDTEPSFVTTTVFVSTLLSPLTLTPLLAYLSK